MKRYLYSFNKSWGPITLPIWLSLAAAFLAFTSITWEKGSLKQSWVIIRKGVYTVPDVCAVIIPIALCAVILLAMFYRKEALLAFAPLPVIYALLYEHADSMIKCVVFLAVPCVLFLAAYALLCAGLLPRAEICSAVCFCCALYFPLSVVFDFVPLLESYNFNYGASYKLSQTAVYVLMFCALGVYCLGLTRKTVERERPDEKYEELYEPGSTGDALKEKSRLTAEDDIIK